MRRHILFVESAYQGFQNNKQAFKDREDALSRIFVDTYIKVYVHYVGTLTDGDKFDSSRDRGDRFSFNLGKSEVIKGWDQGVATMKLGEKAMFTIKPDYGYGSAGSPPKIPGKAWRVVLQKGPSEGS